MRPSPIFGNDDDTAGTEGTNQDAGAKNKMYIYRALKTCMQTAKAKYQDTLFKNVLSAVKKLSAEEKQLLRLQLFSADALGEVKAFELQFGKKRKRQKKTDDEIVRLTTSIRRKKYANAKKMLH